MVRNIVFVHCTSGLIEIRCQTGDLFSGSINFQGRCRLARGRLAKLDHFCVKNDNLGKGKGICLELKTSNVMRPASGTRFEYGMTACNLDSYYLPHHTLPSMDLKAFLFLNKNCNVGRQAVRNPTPSSIIVHQYMVVRGPFQKRPCQYNVSNIQN